MSEDSYSVTSSESWFSRIGNSIGGALMGILLFLLSFVLLYWNEGRAVDMARALDETGGAVVTVDPARVDPANDHKPIHLSGKATTTEVLSDSLYGVSAPALRLSRVVEMYQWKETEKSEKRNKIGGGTETVTSYSYSKEWSDKPIDSSTFNSNKRQDKEPHINPEWPENQRGTDFTATKVTVGAFILSPGLVRQIRNSEALPVTEEDRKKISSELQEQYKVVDSRFYRGNSAEPQVGDLRVSFKVTRPVDVSIIAEQAQDKLQPFQPKSARTSIERLQEGTHSSKEMIEQAVAENNNLTWILRLVGWALMAVGIYLVLNPLRILADVLPFLGNIVGFTLGIFAGLVAAGLSLITIAVAWLAHRPVLGIGLLVAAGAIAAVSVMYLRSASKRKR